MSFNAKFKSLIVAFTLCISFACSDSARLPRGWEGSMEGVYRGKRGKLEEVILLQSGGVYSHVCKLDGVEVVNESGKWTVDVNASEIALIPRGHFSKMYDPVSDTVLSQPEKLSLYTYWPLAKDGVVIGIFIGVQSELRLVKQK